MSDHITRRTVLRGIGALGLGAAGAGVFPPTASAATLTRVLVFSKTAGFRHDSIAAGVAAIRQLGSQDGFAVDATEDGGAFTTANLARYQAVVWMSTTGDVLNAAQQTAFESYARHSGLVLQVAGNGNGADITQQPDANSAGQQWRVVDQGGGVVGLVNRQSGLAVDVWGASTANGARISQWTSAGAANQRFQLQRV